VYLNVYLCVFVYSRFIENRLVDLEATNLSFMRCFYHNGVPRRHAARRRPRRWRIGLRTSQEEAKHKVCGLDGWETSVETAGAMDMEDNGEDVEHVRQ
jgi:hypothetical protein